MADEEPNMLYAILGVTPDSDTKEIKKAYRKLAIQHHPDKGGDKETFQSISHAAEVLLSEEKRAAYDRNGGLEKGVQSSMPHTDFEHADAFFRQFFGGRDPFEEFFGRGSRRVRDPFASFFSGGFNDNDDDDDDDFFDSPFGSRSQTSQRSGGFFDFPSMGNGSFMSSSSSSMSTSSGGISKQVFSRTVNGKTVTETKISRPDGTVEHYVDYGDGKGNVSIKDSSNSSQGRAKLTG